MDNKFNMDDKFNLNDEQKDNKDEEIEVLELWEPHADEITDAKDRHIKMSKKTTNRIVIILVALGALLLMWYSTFAQPLASNNEQSQPRGKEWYVHFSSIKLAEQTGEAKETGKPHFSDLVADFYVSFAKAGDTIVYDLTIKNDGSLDARLSDIQLPEEMINGPIIYSVSGIDYNDVLKAGETANMQVTAKYKGGVTPGEVYNKDMNILVNFVQAEE